MPRTDPDEGKYLIGKSRSRSCGSIVELYDAEHPESAFDAAGGRYVTVCVTHSTVANYEKKSKAWQFFPHPNNWCEPCQAAVDAGVKPAEKVVKHKEPSERAPRVKLRPPLKEVVTEAVKLADKDPTTMTVAELYHAGLCAVCRGPLRHPADGHFHESRGYPHRFVCCVCRGLDANHQIGNRIIVQR